MQHTYESLNKLVGAGSIVFNEQGEPFKQSHNLRGVLNHATGRGVVRIHVDGLQDAGRPGAMVTVFYRGGDVGKVYFVDLSHALDWATGKRNGGRASWFTGCEVTSKLWPAGAWSYT